MLGNFFGDNSFFNLELKYDRKYTNKELLFFRYFYKITKVYAEHIIIIRETFDIKDDYDQRALDKLPVKFIFFFVKGSDFFKAKYHLGSLRRNLGSKVLIIRAEKKLINLLFGFFPDPYIHDIQFRVNKNTKKIEATIFFLSFEERGIAVGRNGEYIKAVNKIFERFIHFEDKSNSIKIKCELFQL
jgi:hypothetical protein